MCRCRLARLARHKARLDRKVFPVRLRRRAASALKSDDGAIAWAEQFAAPAADCHGRLAGSPCLCTHGTQRRAIGRCLCNVRMARGVFRSCCLRVIALQTLQRWHRRSWACLPLFAATCGIFGLTPGDGSTHFCELVASFGLVPRAGFHCHL